MSTTRWLPFAAALLMAVAIPARAAIYAVGTGPGCTHGTIQAAIDAAEANPDEDFIRIPYTVEWTNQALVINTAQALHLEGFWFDCDTISSDQLAVIDGTGGGAAPVLRIEGSGHLVTLHTLVIRNGDVAGIEGKGGGIHYRGNGTLTLARTWIFNNTAGLGGGMYLEGTGEAATVRILSGVPIIDNTARDSGGGVFAKGVHLYMTEPDSYIANNHALGYEVSGVPAGGYGGGLLVSNTTGLDGYAIIGSGPSNPTGVGVIHGNTARYGGGVAVTGGDGASTSSHLYIQATQAGVPSKIEQNFASVGGGGIDVRGGPSGSGSGSGSAHLWNASILGNAAREGSAISMHDGSEVAFNFHAPVEPGAAPCPVGEPCGRIVGNVDRDASGQPTGGAVIAIDGEYSVLHLAGWGDVTGPRGIVIQENRGGSLVDMGGKKGVVEGGSLLVTDNEISGPLVRSDGGSILGLSDSTIVGNAIGGDAVLDLGATDDAYLFRLLLWQPGMTSLAGGASLTVERSIVSEAESLGGGAHAVVADPRFVDPAGGDYSLRAASPAIDHAPPVEGDDRDVFGQERDHRLDVIPRDEGLVRDIGAHERASLQPVVLNGDFVAGLDLWFGTTTYWSEENIAGVAGSAHVVLDNLASPGATVYGASQCIHVPGPGTWQLNGYGRAAGASSPSGTDYVELHWEYRRDGGEACTSGAPSAQGMHHLGSIGDNWTKPTEPARITVSAGEWNSDSSITVILAVRDGSTGSPAAVAGWFDGIELRWSAVSDRLFADGFEGVE